MNATGLTAAELATARQMGLERKVLAGDARYIALVRDRAAAGRAAKPRVPLGQPHCPACVQRRQDGPVG